MLMLSPVGGDTFVGNDGFTYSAASNSIQVLVGDGGVRQALSRGWSPIPSPNIPTVVATLATTQNNYWPVGFGSSTAELQLLPPTGGATITGLQGGAIGQTVIIANESATDTISLSHESASSLSTNQFYDPGAATYVIAVNSFIQVKYQNGYWNVLY